MRIPIVDPHPVGTAAAEAAGPTDTATAADTTIAAGGVIRDARTSRKGAAMPAVTAKAIKVTLVVNAASLLTVTRRERPARSVLTLG